MDYKNAKGTGKSENRSVGKGDFGHGANRMYTVSSDSQKKGLKGIDEYKPGNMGYPDQAFGYDY